MKSTLRFSLPMFRKLNTYLPVLLVLLITSHAQTKDAPRTPAAAPTPHHATAAAADDYGPISQMQWFVGRWKSEVKAQNDNPALTVDVDVSWAENHRALVFRVWFISEGKRTPQYTGMYAWDPGEKTLKMWQVAENGNLSIGRARADGNVFHQENHLVRFDGTTQEQRTETVRTGDNGYDWKVQIQKDGQWVDALQLHYERVKTTTNAGGVQ